MSQIVEVEVKICDLKATQEAARRLSLRQPELLREQHYRVHYSQYGNFEASLYDELTPELVAKATHVRVNDSQREAAYRFEEEYTKALLERLVQEQQGSIAQVNETAEGVEWMIEQIAG